MRPLNAGAAAQAMRTRRERRRGSHPFAHLLGWRQREIRDPERSSNEVGSVAGDVLCDEVLRLNAFDSTSSFWRWAEEGGGAGRFAADEGGQANGPHKDLPSLSPLLLAFFPPARTAFRPPPPPPISVLPLSIDGATHSVGGKSGPAQASLSHQMSLCASASAPACVRVRDTSPALVGAERPCLGLSLAPAVAQRAQTTLDAGWRLGRARGATGGGRDRGSSPARPRSMSGCVISPCARASPCGAPAGQAHAPCSLHAPARRAAGRASFAAQSIPHANARRACSTRRVPDPSARAAGSDFFLESTYDRSSNLDGQDR